MQPEGLCQLKNLNDLKGTRIPKLAACSAARPLTVSAREEDQLFVGCTDG